ASKHRNGVVALGPWGAGDGDCGHRAALDVPLIALDTGEMLDRALEATLDLVERDTSSRVVVVDLGAAVRGSAGGGIAAALGIQLPTCSPRRSSRSSADTGRSEIGSSVRLPPGGGRAASVRAEPGWQCKDCPFRSRC